MRPLALAIGATLLVLGCLDVGGKLDTPIEGGGSLPTSGDLGSSSGSLGALGDAGSLGAGGSLGGTFSCDEHEFNSTCIDYAVGTTATDAQAACNGTLQQTTCSRGGLVGRCTLGGRTEYYYSDGATPHTAADAKDNCEFFGGTFTN